MIDTDAHATRDCFLSHFSFLFSSTIHAVHLSFLMIILHLLVSFFLSYASFCSNFMEFWWVFLSFQFLLRNWRIYSIRISSLTIDSFSLSLSLSSIYRDLVVHIVSMYVSTDIPYSLGQVRWMLTVFLTIRRSVFSRFLCVSIKRRSHKTVLIIIEAILCESINTGQDMKPLFIFFTDFVTGERRWKSRIQ